MRIPFVKASELSKGFETTRTNKQIDNSPRNVVNETSLFKEFGSLGLEEIKQATMFAAKLAGATIS